jgi:hypothetical protein
VLIRIIALQISRLVEMQGFLVFEDTVIKRPDGYAAKPYEVCQRNIACLFGLCVKQFEKPWLDLPMQGNRWMQPEISLCRMVASCISSTKGCFLERVFRQKIFLRSFY